MRPVLALALLALVVAAGCAGPAGDAPEPTTETPTRIAEPAATPTATATAELPTVRQTETARDIRSEPQKGDQFLSVMALSESDASTWNSSARATFENLSAERQRVVKRAVECDCNVELDGEFDFNEKSRVEVVAYEGRYYYLRVTIV